MSTTTTDTPTQREPELLGEIVVVIGGSARHWTRNCPPRAR